MFIRIPAPCRTQRSNRLDCRPLHRTAPALVFLPPTTPRHALAHVRYDWMAEPQWDAHRRSVLSDSPQPRCRGRRGRREPRSLCSRAVLLRMRTRSPDRRLGAHPHRWLVQLEQEPGRPWARMARSLPRPLPVLPRSTSDVRPRMWQLRSDPSQGIPCRCGIPNRGGMPCRRGMT
jgi:hypothetical protein